MTLLPTSRYTRLSFLEVFVMASAKIDNQEPGSEARPIVIVALMLATALGDFIEYNLFAASFKRQYRHARLIAYYRRDRPFKDGIVEMNLEIDEFLARATKTRSRPSILMSRPAADQTGT